VTPYRDDQIPIYFLLGETFCVSALPAADFDASEVRPSRNVLDAALAADEEVVFSGAFRCESALPAADLDPLPAAGRERVFEALVPANLEVISLLAM
jgi:hypothetical protein